MSEDEDDLRTATPNYIAEMAKELAWMAERTRHPMLAYLLRVAQHEADSIIKRRSEPKTRPSTPPPH